MRFRRLEFASNEALVRFKKQFNDTNNDRKRKHLVKASRHKFVEICKQAVRRYRKEHYYD